MIFYIIMTKVEDAADSAKYRFTADGVNFGVLLTRKSDGESELLEPLAGDDRKDFFIRAAAKLRKEWRKGTLPDTAEWAS
jgi:hypothetical protein